MSAAASRSAAPHHAAIHGIHECRCCLQHQLPKQPMSRHFVITEGDFHVEAVGLFARAKRMRKCDNAARRCGLRNLRIAEAAS
jgi:hypothetical protein